MPDKIQLPALLDFPDALIPFITQFNNYQYFLLEGGRGGAKSHSAVRFASYLGDITPELRIFNGRETQNTLEESIYQLYKDVITENNLAYRVQANKIDHAFNKTMIRFRGFREKGKINIKGLEGVDILIIDEAQQITADTLKHILPTIRKKGSKVIFLMNRTLVDDPVYVEMKGRPDCLHIKINYNQNKYCPDKLIQEAEVCKIKHPEDFAHIWLGEPMAQTSRSVFRNVRAIVGSYVYPMEPDKKLDYTLGIDLARSLDYTVFTVFCVQLRKVVYWERLENENKTSWEYQEEKAYAIAKLYNNALLVPDSTGVGDPLVERWMRRGLRVYHNQTAGGKETPGVKFSAVNKENLIEKLKIAIELKLFEIPNIKILIDELEHFESTLLPSRTYRYAAPPNENDDAVISLALAVWGIRNDIYEQWQSVSDKQPNEFWQRVEADMKKESSNNSLLSEGRGVIITDIDNEADEFEDPFN